MTLQVDPAALARAQHRVLALHEQLTTEQARLDRRVDALLERRWSGAAAVQFRAAWLHWRRGMDALLAGVALEGDALELARTELVGADASRAAAARRLHERLHDRLDAS